MAETGHGRHRTHLSKGIIPDREMLNEDPAIGEWVDRADQPYPRGKGSRGGRYGSAATVLLGSVGEVARRALLFPAVLLPSHRDRHRVSDALRRVVPGPRGLFLLLQS